MRRVWQYGAVWLGLWSALAAGARSADDLVQRLAKAPTLTVKDVCTPVTTTHRGELMRVPNPDGKTYDLLQWYWRGYGGPTQVCIMDLATGELKQSTIPDRLQIHICGRAIAPDGKLWIATPNWHEGMYLFTYDPATNTFTNQGMKVPNLAGEKRDLTVAPDGKIYGTGSYMKERKAGAYRIDPTTGEITIYGPIGPSHAPHGVWGYSIAADDRYIYVASGKIPWYLVCYDRQTGKDKVLLTTENVGGYVGVRQRRYGCWATATKVLGTDGKRREYWLYQGKAIEQKQPGEKPPWPIPADSKPWVVWPPRPEVSLVRADPDPQGNVEIWVRTPEARSAAPKNPPADAKPEDLGWKVFKFKVPLYPTSIYRLTELPDGRIFGTAGYYEGNFIYDPKTDKAVHMGKIGLSHYATAILDRKIYMSGYPTSPLYVYDPSKPWTAGTGQIGGRALGRSDPRSNPRLLVWLGRKEYAGTHKMYAAVAAADGRAYFGGRWIRDGASGGLAWWDPKTEKAGGFWKPFSNAQITHMTTVNDGKLIVISTRRVSDPLLGKPLLESGRLFLFDVTKGQIVRHLDPVPKAEGAGLVVGVGSRVIGWTENPADKKSSILYAVDVGENDRVTRKVLPLPLPVRIGSNQKEPFDFRLGPDGKVWTFMRNVVVRIAPQDLTIEPVGRVNRGGRIAFSGGDVYLSGSPVLRRIRNIVPQLR